MKLYQENGYVNIRGIIETGLPFLFVVGGRGTGKTYTALKTVIEDKIKFMLMRRTQAQADLISKPEFSPFKALNNDLGWNIITRPVSKYNAAIYQDEEVPNGYCGDQLVNCPAVDNASGITVSLEDMSAEPAHTKWSILRGYTGALSTMSNVRGFDSQDVQLLIYDEFIPERHERPIKNEGAALLNAYETINRNRELQGRKPLQMLCMANANDLSNPIFLELGLVGKAERMKRKGQEVSIDQRRGIGIFMLSNSPISGAKKDTALYRLTTGSEFERMALENDFAEREYSEVKHRPLQEYRPEVAVGELCIYSHKTTGRLYVSTHFSGSPPTYTAGEQDLKRFRRSWGWIYQEDMAGNIDFEEVFCRILLTKYFG